MKKFVLIASIIAALTALLLSAAPGYVSVHTSNNNQTLHFYEHFVNDKNVNIFTGSEKRGNYQVFYNPVFDSTNRKQIGYSSGSCVYTTNTLLECSWSVTFQDGNSISIEGVSKDLIAKDYVNAVTGGTGAYSHIQGEARLHVIKTSSGETQLEYRIVS